MARLEEPFRRSDCRKQRAFHRRSELVSRRPPEERHRLGRSTLPKRNDIRDHNFVALEYENGVQGQLSGTTLAPEGYRDVVEQFFGEKGVIETSENHWRHFRGRGQETVEKSPCNISIDSMSDFISRIAENRPENTGLRGAESTLTAILGRMAWIATAKSPGTK